MDLVDSDELIKLVRQMPQLWDRGNRLHSNRHVLDKCWKQIAAELNADENKVRKKWKYLRDQFSVEYGKIPPTPSGCKVDSYEPKWRYYKSLQFLEEVVTPRVLSKNPRREDDSEDDSSEAESPPPVETKRHHDPKKHKRNPRESKTRSLESENNEHMHFFKSLLPHVRNIPPHLQLSFRNRVQAAVEEFAYRADPGEPYFITCVPEHTTKLEPRDPVYESRDHTDEDE